MVTKKSFGRILFNVLNYALFTLLILLCMYPLWYVLVQSLSGQILPGKGILVPYEFSLRNYGVVFQLEGVFRAFCVSVAKTVLGTGLTVFSCMLLGYLFSKEQMPCRKFLYRFLVITMYVSGGLIPTYLVRKAYGLLNTFWIYILPGMVSAYYVILIKTFVEQLPGAVEESAMIDGANTMTIFTRIIMPMSKPIIATIAVYASVAQWNSWFDNHVFNFSSENLTTMQYLLYTYLNKAERLAQAVELTGEQVAETAISPKGVRMTITIITVLPVLMIYPFMQRYFVKGLTLGAVKG